MANSYIEVGWTNSPDTKTAINATNLGHMDGGIAENRELISQLEGQIADLESSGSGLTDALKTALKTYFTNMQTLFPQLAYVTESNMGNTLISNAQAVVTALNASTTATLVSISAVYSGESVPSGSDLSALKENLVVTATYDDGTSVPVTGYTLSGSIVDGENTITVTYRKVTTTFTVTGLASHTITYNLTNVTSSSDISAVVTGEYYTTTLSYDNTLYDLQSIVVTMGGVDVTNDVYGDGTILITEVTGDIVITAVANEPIINEAVLLQAVTSLIFYSTSDGTTQLAGKGYGQYILVTDPATADSTAKITITNNTGATVAKSTAFYAGQTDNYDQTVKVYAYDASLVYETSSLGIEDGNSITFNANVKKGYKLICTGVAGCDIQVQNVMTDTSYDTDEYIVHDASVVSVGTGTTYYSDDGSTTLGSASYGYHMISDEVFEEDTDVIITWKNTSASEVGPQGYNTYVGCMPPDVVGIAKPYTHYSIKASTSDRNMPQYGYRRVTYTVKAGYHLAVKCLAEGSGVEITFKSKVV